MRAPDWLARVVPPGPRAIQTLTGISAEDWKALARAFPLLPPDPGARAARARARLARLASRALATGRWATRLEGEALRPEPMVYVTAHIGALQALRYALRARGVAAATVLGPFNLDRRGPARTDALFDRRHPLAFPHAFPAAQAHRLRGALRTGSLIVAADLPAGRSIEAAFLGGRLRVDPRPFRLARAAGRRCRAVFLTLPAPGWTLAVGPLLPAGEAEAAAEFARLYAEVARRAPLDLDGTVYRSLAGC